MSTSIEEGFPRLYFFAIILLTTPIIPQCLNMGTKTPNQEGHVANRLKAIEDYRGQSISKWEAISQICTAIWSTTASTDNKQRSTAGDTYLAMLDKHDWLLARASTQGQSGVKPYDKEVYECQGEFNGKTRSKQSASRSGSPTPKNRKFDESCYA